MNRFYPILNISSYICLVIINLLAVQIPFFGRSPGDVSDLFPNLLTPADFSFKIWSLIYILLGIFVFHQVQFIRRKSTTLDGEISTIGYYFLISCLFNFVWLVAWQSLHIFLAFVFIFILWILLIIIYYRLAHFKGAQLVYTLPFSFYLAWVCIAALANLNVLLIDMDFGFFGLSEEYWTAGLIVIGIFGTLFVLYLNEDVWFTLVLIWAFFGIYVKNKQIANGESWVITASLFAMLVLMIIGGWVGFRKWRQKKVI